MCRYYRLYPDCILVRGHVRSAIYDLTRNEIHFIPNSFACLFDGDMINFEESKVETSEIIRYLAENELGEFGLDPHIKPISEECESPSLISNAIIEINEYSNRVKIGETAEKLAEVGCEAIFLSFIGETTVDRIMEIALNFISLSFKSIDIGIGYYDGIDKDLWSIVSKLPLCSKIIVYNSPFTNMAMTYEDVAVKYLEKEIYCNQQYQQFDYSKYAVASLPFYNEALRYNTCLYKKIFIDSSGGIRNCPRAINLFGNIFYESSLLEIVKSDAFQKDWRLSNDLIQKCSDCELRYACQHCMYDEGECEYSVYD